MLQGKPGADIGIQPRACACPTVMREFATKIGANGWIDSIALCGQSPDIIWLLKQGMPHLAVLVGGHIYFGLSSDNAQRWGDTPWNEAARAP
ncbi:hypothetical protein BJF95_01445 [Rhizobium oryziradicis]|uniref:Uncharacterized protein n=1 Tax=Rhizobium oryziradicis TaxID=1867956 RepID=A0A1Q8ZLN4_9HYPH|nr:hypothetical protein BJF95_01445 [Rhizobium oryziradicis]